MKGKKIVTFGRCFTVANKKQKKIEIFVDYLKISEVKTLIDLRVIADTADKNSVYHPANLKKTCFENAISYISFSNKSADFHSKYKQLPRLEKVDFLANEFVIPTLNFIANLETENLPVGLMFNYWDTQNNTKGAFCSYIYKHIDNVSLYHFALGKGDSYDIFTNENLYRDGYGCLASIRRDMVNKSNYYDDSYDTDSGYSNDDLDEMYRDAFDGNPDAQWNID